MYGPTSPLPAWEPDKCLSGFRYWNTVVIRGVRWAEHRVLLDWYIVGSRLPGLNFIPKKFAGKGRSNAALLIVGHDLSSNDAQ